MDPVLAAFTERWGSAVALCLPGAKAEEKALSLRQQLSDSAQHHLEAAGLVQPGNRRTAEGVAERLLKALEALDGPAAVPGERIPLAKAWDANVTLSMRDLHRRGESDLARLRGTPKRFWDEEDWGIAEKALAAIHAGEKSLSAQQTLSVEFDVTPVLPGDIEKSLVAERPDYLSTLLESGVDLWKYRRIIRVTPTALRPDLVHQVLQLDALREGWSYFEGNGNLDIEHLSKQGHAEGEGAKRIRRAGFPYDPKVGKVFYEIGRPIPKTFDPSDCSFLAFVYEDKADNASAANWFWSTIVDRSPATPWKASVGGFTQAPVPAIIHNRDERTNTDQTQLVGVIKKWLWNNTALTLEPVNHHVPPIDLVRNARD